MILAVHIVAANGHPYSAHAIGAEADEIVCQIGPALVRPQDWSVPEGLPHTHRQCVRWGIPLRELLAAVLRMAECADIFVAADMIVADFQIKTWSATDKALQSRLEAWTRPGPERVSLKPHIEAFNEKTFRLNGADDVLAVYREMQSSAG